MNTIPIDLKDIFSDSSFNCRGPITPFDVETLSLSIKAEGLAQPITVQPYDKDGFKYKIVMGHRRYAACKRLGWKEIEAFVSSTLTEEAARTLNLIENLERKDLNPLQEAKAIEWYRSRGMNIREVCKRVGKSSTWVMSRYDILDLEPDIQLEIAAGLLRADQIKALHDIPSRQGRIDAVKRIKEAKYRNESVDIITYNPKKTIVTNVKTKETRNMREMFELQDMVTDSVGPNIATRILAWTSGVISTEEILKSLKEEYPDFNEVQNVVTN